MNQEKIAIVSGLPRSGTSMMMRMLQEGGLEAFTDGIRQPDSDNPHGYFEFEPVKELLDSSDAGWLGSAKGKSVKVVSELLQVLPPNYEYQVIFMRRKMPEILASQKQMLFRNGHSQNGVGDIELGKLFEKHLLDIEDWLEKQPNFDVIYLPYHEVLRNPLIYASKVSEFLGVNLRLTEMAGAVDNSLYRQRS